MRFPAMKENVCAGLPLLDVQCPDTAMTVRPWKSFGAAQMEPSMPAQSCMERFAALDLIWAMTVSLLTHWNLKAALLSEQQDSALMGELEESNGQDLGAEITISARRK